MLDQEHREQLTKALHSHLKQIPITKAAVQSRGLAEVLVERIVEPFLAQLLVDARGEIDEGYDQLTQLIEEKQALLRTVRRMRGDTGDFIVKWWRDPANGGQRVKITQADPRVLMTDGFLALADERYVKFTWDDVGPSEHYPGRRWRTPKVITVRDDYGHEYTYRVVSYDLQRNAWLIEWPD